MPSPFPGMDPYLESEEWEDFQATFNTVIRELLSPRLAPRYVVRAERRVYIESPCELPLPEERREVYLLIRLQETMEVVTVIESLSPANKRAGGDGRREYLEKREEVLQSPSHLVELDLLLGGARLPMRTALPPGDYYAIVSRRQRRRRADVYAWTIRDRLPTIPVPLKKGDPDVPLDLQAAFSTVYDRARYDLTVTYDADLPSPPRGDDAEWMRGLLAGRKRELS